MNTRTASLLTVLLFFAAPLALLPTAQAQDPGDACPGEGVVYPACVPETTPCASGQIGVVSPACVPEPTACAPGQIGPGTPACVPNPTPAGCSDTDPVWMALCTLATSAALGGQLTGSDEDLDGRPDTAAVAVPVGTILLPEGDCPEGAVPVGDQGMTVGVTAACIDPAGSTLLYVQLDYVFNDAGDEWYDLVGPQALEGFDMAVDAMLYDPTTGDFVGMAAGLGARASTLFSHESSARFGAEEFDLAIYVPSDDGDGASCLACIDAVGQKVVFGDGGEEGILDLKPSAGSTYPNQYDHGATAVVLDLPGDNQVGAFPFPDGKTFAFDDLHLKAGDPRASDLDDDGATDVSEFICSSNPTNPRSTCVDKDADGREFQPGGDDDEYTNADIDGDGVLNANDNCPSNANTDQANRDGDGAGDVCDGDVDGDGVGNADDACDGATSALGPFSATGTADSGDRDGDGCRNDEDADDDKDGKNDVDEDCDRGVVGPHSAANDPDGDGCANSEDSNDDNDSFPDSTDNCDTVANDQADTTEVAAGNPADGVGDACDGDKDGDGVPASDVSYDPALDLVPLMDSSDCDDTNKDIGASPVPDPAGAGCMAPGLGDVPQIPPEGFPPEGFPPEDFPPEGFPPEDFPPEGFPPSPGTLLPMVLYPECSPAGEASDPKCDDDVLDVKDNRDLDSDGNTNEPNGNVDFVEERVYYLGDDGALEVIVLQPSAGVGPLPGTAVRLLVNEPGDDVLAVVEQRLAPADAFLCLHTHGTTQLTLGMGATEAAACGSFLDPAADLNDVGAMAGDVQAGFFDANNAPDTLPLFAFTDGDADGVPESLTVNLIDPASCDPETQFCYAYLDSIVVPLGTPEGVPTPDEVLAELCGSGVEPACEPEPNPCDEDPEAEGCGPDACNDGNAGNNAGCPSCEGDLAGGEGCPAGCDPTAPGPECVPAPCDVANPPSCVPSGPPEPCDLVPDLPTCGSEPPSGPGDVVDLVLGLLVEDCGETSSETALVCRTDEQGQLTYALGIRGLRVWIPGVSRIPL